MMSPLLVTPESPDALDGALASGADAVVLDLGDDAADRAARRDWAAEALARRSSLAARLGSRRPAIVVRVAALAGGLSDADLGAVMPGAPDAVWLPGCVGGRDLQHLGAKLAVREAEHSLAAGHTRIVAAPADTAAGVLALATLPDASPRLLALVWEPAALAASLDADADASPLRHARDLLVIAAAAAGVPAIDRGLQGDDLDAACRAARRDGFAGRVARGVDEVAAIAEAFGSRHPHGIVGRPVRTDGSSVWVGPLTPDHPGFEPLRDDASREGFAFLDRLVGEWVSGANRFDGPGERLIGAFAGARLVGVCGLNRDPYIEHIGDEAAVGRLRHLYVSPLARKRGVGTALVARVLAAARPAFARVRLRTDAAAAFYEARGFAAVGDGSSTHSVALR